MNFFKKVAETWCTGGFWDEESRGVKIFRPLTSKEFIQIYRPRFPVEVCSRRCSSDFHRIQPILRWRWRWPLFLYKERILGENIICNYNLHFWKSVPKFVPVRKIRTGTDNPYQNIRTRTVPKKSVPPYPYHVPYRRNPYHIIRTTYRTNNIRTALSVPRTVPKNPYHFIRTTYRTKKIRTEKHPYHVPDRTITYRRYGQPCSSTRLTSNEGS